MSTVHEIEQQHMIYKKWKGLIVVYKRYQYIEEWKKNKCHNLQLEIHQEG